MIIVPIPAELRPNPYPVRVTVTGRSRTETLLCPGLKRLPAPPGPPGPGREDSPSPRRTEERPAGGLDGADSRVVCPILSLFRRERSLRSSRPMTTTPNSDGCDIYHQHIGTAMGTSFSVVYTVIFMIHLESPILEDPRFRPFIQLYKRHIDGNFLIWTASAATLCEFRRALGSADDTIQLDWDGYESQTEALDRTVVEAKRHDRAEFLDLDICVERSRPATQTRVGSWYLTFKPYHTPGNAHAYIPFTSSHARHTYRGWVLAELLRLLTHSKTVEIWQQEGELFSETHQSGQH
jgi:hypothetical protein